jgi:hypothetical protein
MRDVVTLDAAPVETGGLTEVGNFTIRADAKAFRVLIDSLYSNKPLAIIRELSSNAYDSHVLAGIMERPIKWQLPTRWDDAFSVRDYGVSLTHEQVMGIYTTVFASSKEDSNTQVGKFGLGSKTPFSYTDSFTVTAILAGEKRLYNCYMDAGLPKIALMIMEPTDEEQGLEVRFSVRADDVASFHAAAKRVALGLPVLPVNNIDLTTPERAVIFEGAGWQVVKQDRYEGLTGAMVRQGCVLYPVDAQALHNVRRCEALDVLAETAIIVDMPIGSVDITPSRESLSYDPTTCENLLSRFDGILDEVTNKMIADVRNAPSRFAATRIRNSILAGIQNYRLQEHLKKVARWRGRVVQPAISVSEANLKSLRRRGIDLHSISHRPDGWSGRHRYRSQSSRRHAVVMRGAWNNIDPNRMPTFIYYTPSDTPKHLTYRLAAADLSCQGETVLLPNYTPGCAAEKFLIAALGRPDEPLVFKNLMEFAFDKPVAGPGGLPDVKEMDDDGNFVSCETPEEDAEDIFYVHTYKGLPRKGLVEQARDTLTDIWGTMKRIGLVSAEAKLIGIPASRKDIANAIPEDWMDFYAVVGDLITAQFDPELASRGQAAVSVKSESNRFLDFLEMVHQVGRPTHDDTSLFRSIGAEFKRNLAEEAAGGAFQIALVSLIRKVFDTSLVPAKLAGFDMAPHVTRLHAGLRQVKKTYPLLEFLVREASYISSKDKRDFDTVVDYVDMIDAQENARRAETALCDAFSVD